MTADWEETTELVTSKYHWVNGIDEYLKRTKHPLYKKFSAIRNAVFFMNAYRQKELILDEIGRGDSPYSEEFINIILHGNIQWTEWLTHKKLVNYMAHCIDIDLFKILNDWHDRFGGDVININDQFSRGQIQSKLWMMDELDKIVEDGKMGNVLMYGGWFNTFAYFLFERFKIKQIFSLDIDPDVWEVADCFNAKKCYDEAWTFKAATADCNRLQYKNGKTTFEVPRPNMNPTAVEFKPNLVINTSCDHMKDDWFYNLPKGMPVCLQTNDYFENTQHMNCVHNLDEARAKYQFSEELYGGELKTYLYKRYTLIGIV